MTIFLANDIEIAKQLAVPSYVQFLKNGSIRSYTTGKTNSMAQHRWKSLRHDRVAHGVLYTAHRHDCTELI